MVLASCDSFDGLIGRFECAIELRLAVCVRKKRALTGGGRKKDPALEHGLEETRVFLTGGMTRILDRGDLAHAEENRPHRPDCVHHAAALSPGQGFPETR